MLKGIVQSLCFKGIYRSGYFAIESEKSSDADIELHLIEIKILLLNFIIYAAFR